MTFHPVNGFIHERGENRDGEDGSEISGGGGERERERERER